MKNGIVVFDGDCLMCNSLLKYVMKKVKVGTPIFFISSGTPNAQMIFDCYNVSNIEDSLYYFRGLNIYNKAEAVIQILNDLIGMHKFFGQVLNLFPTSILNYFYKVVANNRYLFNKNQYCEIDKDVDSFKYRIINS